MPGQLFTQYFLTDGIRHTPEWRASTDQPQAFSAFASAAAERFAAFSRYDSPNESVTEQELIRPVLVLLGWVHTLPQQGAARNEDIPDHLLFADAESKNRAAGRSNSEQRYRDALLIEESKRFGLPLDSRDAAGNARSGTPHGQIRRYLSTADAVTDGRLRWGILTNGGVWRLYDYRARPRASGYYEADLVALLRPGCEDALRTFYLLLRRASFTPQDGAPAPFLEAALAEGRRYEEQVARDLSNVVFDTVFPGLVSALARTLPPHPGSLPPPAYSLPDIRDAALIFLYRLLFVLYAEDRGLLPVNDPRYDDYGLRRRVRDDVARRTHDGDTFSAHAASYYNHLTTLFTLIDKGDASIGLPPYNGGLFAPDAAPLLETVRLPDAVVAPIIHAMSHREGHFVNYRDMSVQQLGSIYERLLEREPVRGADGSVAIQPNAYARKDSGSFYTPQELVDLIVDRTLKPLAEERLKAFEDRAAALQHDRRPKAERLAELRELDPAEAVLDLKVLDPAMGSGHFLVTAVDFLSDYIAELIEYHPRGAGVAGRRLRLATGAAHRTHPPRHPGPRRGVRLGPRRSATDGPGHHPPHGAQALHLRRGQEPPDGGTGQGVAVAAQLHGGRAAVVSGPPFAGRRFAHRRAGAGRHRRVAPSRRPVRRLRHCRRRGRQRGHAAHRSDVRRRRGRGAGIGVTVRARGGDDRRPARPAGLPVRLALADGRHEEAATGRSGGAAVCGPWSQPRRRLHAVGPWSSSPSLWEGDRGGGPFCRPMARRPRRCRARGLPALGGRLSRRLATLAERPAGGRFRRRHRQPAVGPHQVAGSRVVRHPRPRSGAGTHCGGAAQGYPKTARRRRPAGRGVRRRQGGADSLGQLVRACGDYPLLGGGDVNLYSLFVERALRLVKPDGLVGLLTPSGIYADKTAADFFKSVSTGGRVGGLFDFENKKIFFKDIHASFKFCALIVGGETRRFNETRCAFFLHDTAEIDNADRCFPLSPSDFARVNPNTGTAPVFRTRRDADITRRIYDRHPVLVDRSGGGERKAWRVKYRQGLFHSQNDSGLFRTAEQLESDGFYPVESNRWKKGDELYLPLFEGKSVQAFDHRAASISTRSDNLFRPGQPVPTLESQHQDPYFTARPRFWVNQQERIETQHEQYLLTFKDITATTNMRTVIAAVVPRVGCSDTLAVLLPEKDRFSVHDMACLLANLNAFGFDYVARQKVPSTHLKLYMIEQLPVIAPADYDRPFGPTTARALVRDHVLRLTYTAHDMAPFARDLGLRRPALPLARRRPPPPARPPRRPLLPPLRPVARRRRLRARHLPHRPPRG